MGKGKRGERLKERPRPLPQPAALLFYSHGLYKGRPNLDFDRLREVKAVCNPPLVLHGGSGIPADMIRTAIEIGIRKINVATEVRLAYIKGMLEASCGGDYYTMTNNGKKWVREMAKEKIKLFNRTD